MKVHAFILSITLLLVLPCYARARERLLGRRLTRGAASTADIQSIKNDMTRHLEQTEIPLLLQVQGQPGLLNEYEYTVLEDTFVQTYNTLAQSLCPDIVVPLVHANIAIDRDATNAFPGDGTVSRIFILSSTISIANGAPLFWSMEDIAVRRQLRTPRRLTKGGGKGKSGNANAAMALVNDNTRKDCPGLTETAFALAFREAVRNKSGELGTSIVDVTDVAEMGPVACGDAATYFFSDLAITFTGDPMLWKKRQEQVLIQSFEQTYRSLNSLNPDTCDLLFRDVFNVTLKREQEFNRRLKEQSHGSKEQRSLQAGTTFSYLYRVTGTCRGCDTNSRLFAQGSTGRNLLPSTSVPSDDGIQRHLQNGECMCPVTASESRAPTDDEFRTAYETTIGILQEENAIDSAFIESIVNVKQVQQKNCAATETFETRVNVELSGTPSAVEQDEIQALERGFINTFKELSTSFCDPLFRTPINVTIDTGVGRRLQTGLSFTYQYAVKGQCRGCVGNSRLFGQAVRRMLTTSTGAAATPHLQEDNNPCFCSIDSFADRAPTKDEFAVVYNETIKELDLVNIRHVVSVNEQGSYDEPDMTPEAVISTSTDTYGNKPTSAPVETAGSATDLTTRPTCSPTV